jgi:hypothetical protein
VSPRGFFYDEATGAYFARYPREVGAWFDLGVTKTTRQATLTGEWDAFFERCKSRLRYSCGIS